MAADKNEVLLNAINALDFEEEDFDINAAGKALDALIKAPNAADFRKAIISHQEFWSNDEISTLMKADFADTDEAFNPNQTDAFSFANIKKAALAKRAEYSINQMSANSMDDRDLSRIIHTKTFDALRSDTKGKFGSVFQNASLSDATLTEIKKRASQIQLENAIQHCKELETLTGLLDPEKSKQDKALLLKNNLLLDPASVEHIDIDDTLNPIIASKAFDLWLVEQKLTIVPEEKFAKTLNNFAKKVSTDIRLQNFSTYLKKDILPKIVLHLVLHFEEQKLLSIPQNSLSTKKMLKKLNLSDDQLNDKISTDQTNERIKKETILAYLKDNPSSTQKIRMALLTNLISRSDAKDVNKLEQIINSKNLQNLTVVLKNQFGVTETKWLTDANRIELAHIAKEKKEELDKGINLDKFIKVLDKPDPSTKTNATNSIDLSTYHPELIKIFQKLTLVEQTEALKRINTPLGLSNLLQAETAENISYFLGFKQENALNLELEPLLDENKRLNSLRMLHNVGLAQVFAKMGKGLTSDQSKLINRNFTDRDQAPAALDIQNSTALNAALTNIYNQVIVPDNMCSLEEFKQYCNEITGTFIGAQHQHNRPLITILGVPRNALGQPNNENEQILKPLYNYLLTAQKTEEMRVDSVNLPANALLLASNVEEFNALINDAGKYNAADKTDLYITVIAAHTAPSNDLKNALKKMTEAEFQSIKHEMRKNALEAIPNPVNEEAVKTARQTTRKILNLDKQDFDNLSSSIHEIEELRSDMTDLKKIINNNATDIFNPVFRTGAQTNLNSIGESYQDLMEQCDKTIAFLEHKKAWLEEYRGSLGPKAKVAPFDFFEKWFEHKKPTKDQLLLTRHEEVDNYIEVIDKHLKFYKEDIKRDTLQPDEVAAAIETIQQDEGDLGIMIQGNTFKATARDYPVHQMKDRLQPNAYPSEVESYDVDVAAVSSGQDTNPYEQKGRLKEGYIREHSVVFGEFAKGKESKEAGRYIEQHTPEKTKPLVNDKGKAPVKDTHVKLTVVDFPTDKKAKVKFALEMAAQMLINRKECPSDDPKNKIFITGNNEDYVQHLWTAFMVLGNSNIPGLEFHETAIRVDATSKFKPDTQLSFFSTRWNPIFTDESLYEKEFKELVQVDQPFMENIHEAFRQKNAQKSLASELEKPLKSVTTVFKEKVNGLVDEDQKLWANKKLRS